MPLILASNSASGGYNVANSLRFNSGSSDYLNRTPASAGNRQIFTVSLWTKINGNTSRQVLFWTPTSSSTFAFFDSGELRFGAGDGADWYYVPTQLFRDPSAWYHLVFAVDTTQATATNRVKLYVNGSQITSFSSTTNPTQNLSSAWNNNAIHYMGAGYDGGITYYYGGYMSEFYNIDGQQLTPSSFGETDPATPSSGIWVPKAYTGSFGTNGFYLQFKNSAALGTDSSGNGNTFTVNNLTSVDQSTDTPTNNFATLNPLANFRAGATLTEGNLKASLTTTKAGVPATVGVSTGKWYWENKIDTLPVDGRFGIGIVPFEPVEADDFYNANNKGIGLSGFNSIIYASGTGINDFYGNATGRWSGFTGIIGVALDLSSGTKTIAMSRDGAWITGSNTTDSVFANALKVDITSYVNAYDFWNPIIGSSNGSSTTGVISLNFGSPSFTIASGNTDGAGFGNFEYAVPSGYYSLNTKNLANFG